MVNGVRQASWLRLRTHWNFESLYYLLQRYMAFISTFVCSSLQVAHFHLRMPYSSSLRRTKAVTWTELFLPSWDEISQTKLTRNISPTNPTFLLQMRWFYSLYMDDYSPHILRRISLPWTLKLGLRDTLRDRWRNSLVFLHEYLNTPLGLGNQLVSCIITPF